MSWNNELQRTPEWLERRRGKITASRVHRIVNGTARGWASLAAELLNEMSPDYQMQHVYAPSLENGKLYEPVAIANAQLILGEEFNPVGFETHPEYDFIGCSSDFLAREGTYNGEVKCPLTIEKHLMVRMNGQMPKEHYPQVQLQMAVHDVRDTIFISYYSGNKRLVPEMLTGITEVRRDDRYIDNMIARCLEFRRYLLGMRAEDPSPLVASNIPPLF